MTSSSYSLDHFWLSGRTGCLNAREQLRAVAYRAVMRNMGLPEHGMHTQVDVFTCSVPREATCGSGAVLNQHWHLP